MMQLQAKKARNKIQLGFYSMVVPLARVACVATVAHVARVARDALVHAACGDGAARVALVPATCVASARMLLV